MSIEQSLLKKKHPGSETSVTFRSPDVCINQHILSYKHCAPNGAPLLDFLSRYISPALVND
jgi:hypothetical protein